MKQSEERRGWLSGSFAGGTARQGAARRIDLTITKLLTDGRTACIGACALHRPAVDPLHTALEH